MKLADQEFVLDFFLVNVIALPYDPIPSHPNRGIYSKLPVVGPEDMDKNNHIPLYPNSVQAFKTYCRVQYLCVLIES